MKFKERLQQLKESAGLNMVQLAEMIKTPYSTVSKWMCGYRCSVPNPSTLRLIEIIELAMEHAPEFYRAHILPDSPKKIVGRPRNDKIPSQ